MPTQNRPEIAPDFEDHHLLVLEVLDHLGVNPEQVIAGSITITLGNDGDHLVSWESWATVTTTQLAELANLADAKADAR